MHEFDRYIENYRKQNDNALWLSGQSSEFFAHYKAEKLKSWFPNLIHGNILDFGCGDGLMTYAVSRLFEKAEIYGVDPSEKSIAYAQCQYPQLHFMCNNADDTLLNFSDNTFDLIFSAGTFHHIPFAMHHAYIQELIRILRKQGTLVIFELNSWNPLTIVTFKRNPIDKNARMLSPWYAYNLMRKFGKPSFKFISFFPKFLNWFQPSEPFLTKIPLGALYAAFIKKI